MEKVKRSVVPEPGEGEGGMNMGDGCTEDFLGQWNYSV